MKEMAVPALPMLKVGETRAFYEALGFDCAHEQAPPDTFLIMTMRTIQIHFFEYSGVNPHANFASCTIMTPQLDLLHAQCAKAGVAKVLPIENKPWGTREFAFFDPAGNLIRFQEQHFEI
jgi:catechol 2,3-dioxygenase-like lactoylglutathione lyase family enzyme